MNNEEKLEKACKCFSAIAHPLRLAIINALAGGELTVNDIVKITEASQSNVSQHLAIMKNKGVLVSKREGTQIYYSVKNKKLIEVIKMLEDVFCK